jgi:hypothetical protein
MIGAGFPVTSLWLVAQRFLDSPDGWANASHGAEINREAQPRTEHPSNRLLTRQCNRRWCT